MKLEINDLKGIITECVQRILEYHSAIDDSLEKLADIIIDKFEKGGGSIEPEVVNSINPYFKTNKSLIVIPVNGASCVASYNINTNEIEINSGRYVSSSKMKEDIMHELSHFIDLNMRTKPRDPVFQLSTYGETDAMARIADDIIYLFSPTEIQARLSQFKQLLKRLPNQANKDLTEHSNEKCLRLAYMEELIEIFDECRFGYKSEDIVQIMAYSVSYSRAVRKGKDIENAAWGDSMSERDFKQQKEKIKKILRKRWRSMWQKASKIKFDALN